MEHLLEQEQAEQAASLCPKILKKDQKIWDHWLNEFGIRNQLKAIGPYIPVTDPKLSAEKYDLVLRNYLEHGYLNLYKKSLLFLDTAGFLKLIEKWPHDIYSTPVIISALEKVTDKDENLSTALTM